MKNSIKAVTLFISILFATSSLFSEAKAQDKYYWVGGSGEWSDLTHWASSSGGAGSAYTTYPTITDSVFFDENSTTDDTTIEIDIDVSDARMAFLDASGTSEDVEFTGSNSILIQGASHFSRAVIFSVDVVLNSSSSVVLDPGGGTFDDILLTGTGSWSLQDSLSADSLYLDSGTLATNDHSINLKGLFQIGDALGTLPWSLDLGSSKVYVSEFINRTDNSFTPDLDAGNSTITVSGAEFRADRDGAGTLDFNKVIFANASDSVKVYDDASFEELIIKKGVTLEIEAGSKQNIEGSLTAVGTSDAPITLLSSSSTTQATINSSGTTINVFYTDLEGINATGTSSFNAYYSTDSGNNSSKWNFESDPYLLSSFSPADDVTDVDPNEGLELIFSATVTEGNGAFLIYNGKDDSLFDSVHVSSSDVIITGTTVTVTHAQLQDTTNYYVLIEDSTLFSESDDIAINFPYTSSSWNFKTADITAPVLEELTPVDDEKKVDISTELQLVFNEAVTTDNGSFSLFDSDDNLVSLIDAKSADVSGSGTETITVNIPDLELGKRYYVLIGSNVIVDGSGNYFEGISDKAFWNFQTDDTEAPTLISSDPADDAKDVDPEIGEISLTFSEDILTYVDDGKLSDVGSLYLYDLSNTLILEANEDAGNLAFDKRTATITIPSLSSSTGYYILIDENAIEDYGGNAFAGITDSTILGFTTADVIAPMATSFSPADDVQNVSVNVRELQITFNENMIFGASGNVSMYTGDGTEIFSEPVTSDSVSISGNTLTIKIPVLSSFTDYYVNIDDGFVTDESGNSYKGVSDNTTWNFTTEDVEEPVVTLFSPVDNNKSVPKDIRQLQVAFNENVLLGSEGNISLFTNDGVEVFSESVTSDSVNVSVNMLTISIPILSSLTSYYVNIDEGFVIDEAGNLYTGISDNTTWNFTTEDIEGPTVVELIPANGNTEVVPGSNTLEIVFSEKIIFGKGNVRIQAVDLEKDVAWEYSLSRDSDSLSISDDTLAITVDTLRSFTRYIVTVDSGIVTDFIRNDFTGIDESAPWEFTTLDTKSPTVLIFAPSDNESDVSPDQKKIAILFSEPIEKGTGVISLNEQSGTSVFNEDVSSTSVTIDNKGLTITLSTSLASETEYYVLVEPGAVQDLSGNPFIGIESDTVWNFSTSDVVPPTIVALSPEDDATDVDPNISELIITFSEEVTFAEEGSILVYEQGEGIVIEESINHSDSISIDGNKVIIGIDPLLPSSKYYVEIISSFVTDIPGNPFEGISDNTSWNFETTISTGIEEDLGKVTEFELDQNFPNPFNPTTRIDFAVPVAGPVTITVYNIMGQEVGVLVDEVKQPGKYTMTWDARNLASGPYFYRLEASGTVLTRTMTLIK